MKIGQHVHFGIGGADKACENLIQGLKQIAEVTIIVFYNNFSIPLTNDINNAGLSRFKNYNNINTIKIDSVSEFNNYEIDILGTHRPGDDTWALPNFENTKMNFKIIETNVHGQLMSKADIRIFPSKALVDFYHINIPHFILPNSILPPVTQQNLREKLGIENKFVYGHITRPSEDIYCDITLRAYKLIESDDNIMLYVAPSNSALMDAKKLGIKNIIFFEPTIDNNEISKIYNTFDILCHSNKIGETFGNTVAESMIHGKPVISHKGFSAWPQAQKEVLGESCEYLYIENVNETNYSSLMKKLQNDKNFYNEMSVYLKNKAEKEYDYKIVSKKYFEICKEIINV